MDVTTNAATPFSDVLDQLERARNAFHAKPSEEWRQGRTLFGGLSAALAVSAAQQAFPDLPPLRSAQFAFSGPAMGDLELTPRVLRAGKSTTFVEVHGQSNDETSMTAILVFGATRRSSYSYRPLPMPEVPPPGSLPVFFDESFAPRFTRKFDAQFAGGARPVSGADVPELLLWLRHRDDAAPDNVASIIALGDACPPGAITMFVTFPPMSTITWSIDVLADKFIGSGWHLMHVAADSLGEGYSSQHMTLWHASGVPVLAARQVVAIFE
jgi:acyl-CoA thioesterase